MKPRRKKTLQFLLLFALALLQYANTYTHDYAWDDAIVITENTRVQKGLSNIPELFENIKTSETQNRYGYRPISLLSFAADVELFGMNPNAAHGISILLYGLLAMLVFYFLNAFFPSDGWRNFVITALFVVHPLHTEVVANIKSRDEILAMVFGLIGLLAFLKSFRADSVLYYFISALFLVISFLSKESGVAFIGIAACIPWFYSQGGLRNFSWGTVALAIMAGLILLSIRAYVYSDLFFQSDDAVLATKGLFHQDGFVGNPLVDYNFSERVGMALYLIPFFIYKMLWPYPLLHDYSYNQLEVVTWGDWQILLAIPVCLFLVALMLKGLYQRKKYGFGLTFFFATSSVYLHLVETAPDIFAERFLFAPSLGLLVCLLSFYDSKLNQRYVNLTLLVLIIPAFVYSFQRNTVWKNNETLIKTDIKKLPNCARANYNLALMLHAEYYELSAANQQTTGPQIIAAYERTVDITDRLLNAEVDLSAAYMEFGMPDKAYPRFKSLAARYPGLSTPFVQLGKYYISQKDFASAIPNFEKALENGDQNSDYHYLLAICQFNTGERQKAINTLLEGEKLGVSAPSYFALEAQLYLKLGEEANALLAYNRGLEVFPTSGELQQKRGLLLQQ